jgi:spore germination protein KB
MLVTVFMKVTIFYYVTVLGIAQTLKLRSYTPLIVPIGAIAIAIATTLYPSDMEQIYAGQYIWPFNAAVNEFIIPIITIMVIAIRKILTKEGEESQ